MRKMLISLLLSALLLSTFLPCAAEGESLVPEVPDVQMALLYEESTDTLLFTKRPDALNAPASMTKVMTAVLVLEQDPELTGTAVVTADAISEENCYWMDTFHLVEGEELPIRALMEYLLIPSANEAATTLAIHYAGDIPTFLDRMNARARELGMEHTHYDDPHGLSPANQITCEDMLILARHAMKNETFREIVSMTSGILPPSNKRPSPYRYNTSNRVLAPRSNPIYDGGFSDDIVGIKTGFITPAGYNLACCMEYDDMTFYSVVMHGREMEVDGDTIYSHYSNTVNLMRYARQFHRTGFAAGTRMKTAKTDGSLTENLPVCLQEDLFVLAREGENLPVELKLDAIGKRVDKDTPVGTASITDEFGNVHEVALVAAEVASTGFVTSVTGVTVLGAAAVVLLIVIIVLVKKKKA